MTTATVAKAPTGVWALRARGFREFWRKFLRRRDGVLGLGILVFFTVMAIAPWLFVGPLETVLTASGTGFESPSVNHILGTDELGRDILNLTVHGARVSMIIGLAAAHETDAGRTAGAVLAPFVVCCGIILVFSSLIIAAVHGAMQSQ